MERGLKILLLALCALAVMSEKNNVLAKPEAKDTTQSKVEDPAPKYRNITLSVTIRIPKQDNNDTRFTMTSLLLNAGTIQFTRAAERPGPKTPCNISSCGPDNVPELAVFIFQETPEKYLTFSTNVTNEDLFLTVNASTSEISVITKKKLGTLNSASASVQLILGQPFGLQFGNSDTFAVKTEQLWIPTTTAIPTTKTTVVTTSKVTSKQTTKAPERHVTTIRKITQKPAAHIITKKHIIIPQQINNGSSLVRGGLWGMVMLVLIQIFLN